MSAVCSGLEYLFPPFREQVEKVITIVKPANFAVFETLRSLSRQLEIYKKGRELQNGVWVVVNPKEVATKAPPGSSFHAYGIAVDMVPHIHAANIKLGLQWSWEDYDLTKSGIQVIPWNILLAAYRKCGLVAGGDWKKFPDLPHAENSYGFKYSELYPILTSDGLPAVWKKLLTKVPANKSMVVSTLPTAVIAASVPASAAIPQIPVTTPTVKELDSVHADDKQIGFIGRILKLIFK